MYHLMVSESIIRTDKWRIKPTEAQREMLKGTQSEYRAFVRALVGVVYVHFNEISKTDSPVLGVEALIHPTKKRPSVRYDYFSNRFRKFPSYMRRAAINFVFGQVASFVTRYDQWQSGQRSRRDAKPPRLNAEAMANVALYRGQCLKLDDDFETAEIKVWNGSDWVWTAIPITQKRNRHKVVGAEMKSTSLLLHGKNAYLSVPFDMPHLKYAVTTDDTPVCAVDLGINTTATACIVYPDGTVTAQRFIHRGADIDRRDKGLAVVRRKAKKTKKLSSGFCRGQYRKGVNRNKDMANRIARELYEFALEHGAHGFVFEKLKSFRPHGGRKRSTLRQRFHGWLHRKLVDRVKMLAEEMYMSVTFVYARETSSWAYDGSGRVARNNRNHALCVFGNGKQYNCDLNASYNIAARYWWQKLTGRKSCWPDAGKRSGSRLRIPVTLSTLWSWSEAELETATIAQA